MEIENNNLTNEDLEQVFGGEDEEQDEKVMYWECLECGAKDGPLTVSEEKEAVFNHMKSTGHLRIFVYPK